VTVARQLGAGGERLARMLAERLGWRLLDRALVRRVAEELQVAPEEVRASERGESFLERLGQYLAEGFPELAPMVVPPPSAPEQVARAARRVLARIVEQGPAVVVGLGAQCILQEEPRAVHLLVVAPFPVRLRRMMERWQLDEDAARERLQRADAARRAYIRDHFGREWLDPTLYHLCLDTGRLGHPLAVELAERAVRRLLG